MEKIFFNKTMDKMIKKGLLQAINELIICNYQFTMNKETDSAVIEVYNMYKIWYNSDNTFNTIKKI